PWLLGKPNLLGINLYYSTRGTSVNYYQPYDLGVKGISLRFGRRFRWPDSYFRGSWSLSFSEKSYTNIDTDEDGNYVDVFYYQNPQGFLITQGNSFTQIISRDNRNRPEFPTMGSSVSLSTKYSGGILGGQEDFIKNKFSLEWWTPILPKLVVYQNFQSGLINVFSDNSVVPYDERFYMGGAGLISYTTSLRGYPDQSVGPWRSGYPLGGKGILKYSMELRYLITDNPTLYGFVFAESGQVWDDFNQININKMARSAGSGVRVFMPMIGLLGFDIGYGFDDINGDDKADGWETHFVFGMPF
ncbi:MAG: BamA/TamA family outer membrane protein, partial [Candidatus Marinimicrobia bacterium]|nr:BamA/TamA family outer membrane protein [Candidatus Neomarinimicrobiota bacterium]